MMTSPTLISVLQANLTTLPEPSMAARDRAEQPPVGFQARHRDARQSSRSNGRVALFAGVERIFTSQP